MLITNHVAKTRFIPSSEKYCSTTTLIERTIYSETCIKRSPLGQRKCGLRRQVTS